MRGSEEKRLEKMEESDVQDSNDDLSYNNENIGEM